MSTSKKKLVIAHTFDKGSHEVVAELRVLVMPSEDGGYFAQGLEIDYVATGATEEEARDHFAEGFVRTVRTNIERGRGITGLFKSRTPGEYWQQFYAASTKAVFGCMVTADVTDELPTDAPVPGLLRFSTLRPHTA